MKLKHIFMAAAVTILASCSAPKQIEYFQDVNNGTTLSLADDNQIKVQPGDKLSIVVNSYNSELAMPFNLPYVSNRLGQGSTAIGSNASNTSSGISVYTVDANGDIDFPILGKLHIAGMTRPQVADDVKTRIIKSGKLGDPVVIVEYANLAVSVMGEVARPGRYAIDRDNFTILDALSAAGDLTIYGRRENVKVIRTSGNQKQVYTIDLCNAQSLTSSPVFNLQQGDMVYVAPNDMRARQSTVNGNNVLSTSFWISLASLLTSVAVLIFK